MGQGLNALKINGRRGLAGGWAPLKEDRRLCGGLLKKLPQGLCLLVQPVSCKSSGTRGKSRLVASQRELSIFVYRLKQSVLCSPCWLSVSVKSSLAIPENTHVGTS